MRVRDCMTIGGARVLQRSSKPEVFRLLADLAVATDPHLTTPHLLAVLDHREFQGGTVIAPGVAIPHAVLQEASRVQIIPVLVRGGCQWGQSDSPITLIFGIIGPSSSPWNHVQLLARLARLLKDPEVLARFRAAETAEDFEGAIRSEDERHD